MVEGGTTPRVRRRRIIERPRLFRALDRSKARVRTLIGGPGFGKTILLEQWAPRDGRTVVWFRARRSAADVAVVARGLVAATSQVVPDAGRRLLERLAVTDDPEREAVLLAEMLAEDLEQWPDDAWIVIDDYHHLAVSAGCEAFVETIVNRAPVRLLLASRLRPAWVAGRSILYDEVLELPQGILAMSAEEAEEVLDGARPELTAGLLALAEGWPAVIGLAGMTPGVTEIDADLPETLYEFFADELYRALDPTIRTGLAVLAAMPSVDAELAAVLLGDERAEKVCAESLALGIVDEREGRLELHPLAAAFLEQRGRLDTAPELAEAVELGLEIYRSRREWDACFEIVSRFLLDDQLPPLFVAALDELVFGARLVALETWVAHARARRIDEPIVDVADAELSLRHGRHVSALTSARSAIDRENGDDEVRYRAYVVAARAAHVASQEDLALSFYQRACESTADHWKQREALWGQVMCQAALEREESLILLGELEQSATGTDARDHVRMVDKQLSVGFRFGYVRNLSAGRTAAELVPRVDDPLVRCSFRSMLSWALVLGAHYEEALGHAAELIDDATEHRVDLALPYGFATSAAAMAGLRRFAEAEAMIDEAAAEARRVNDENGVQNAYAIRVRILLQQQLISEACALEPPDVATALPSMHGEVTSSRALALASIGRIEESRALATASVVGTSGIEANTLALVTHAVLGLKTRESAELGRCSAVMDHAFQVGSVDLVVTAYRANRDLLGALVTASDTRERIAFLVQRAGDSELLAALGTTTANLVDPLMALSAREREVHDLVCLGLSNRQIAKRLFISESTVKVHVHHAFDKLGIRSRVALALNAAARTQAAPTENATDDAA